jgi:outer membrane murein-binding lipoprotein Lpp
MGKQRGSPPRGYEERLFQHEAALDPNQPGRKLTSFATVSSHASSYGETMTDVTSEGQSPEKKQSSRWATLTAVLGFLTALLVLISTALGIVATRSNKTAEEATNKASDLSSKVEELEKSVETLKQTNDQLARENAALRQQSSPADGTPSAQIHDQLTIENVRIDAGEFKRVAPWEYELDGSRTLDFRFWWTTIANTGRLEGSDCTVVATVKDISNNSIFDRHRTQTCSLTGWVAQQLPAGNYLITVEVRAGESAKGSGEATIKVLP